MKQNKFFLDHAIHIATVCAVLALILFIPASLGSKGLAIFLYIVIGLLLIGGGVILYLAHRGKGDLVHYFLYDHRRNISLSRDELTFELVREGTEQYLSSYVDSAYELWIDLPKKLRIQLEGDTAFRPLIAYRMLLELSTRDPEEILATFEEADDRIIGYLCRAVKDGGDAEMASYIFELKRYIERERSHVPVFFRKNRRCFEDRMLRYVERNYSAFLMDKKRVIAEK